MSLPRNLALIAVLAPLAALAQPVNTCSGSNVSLPFGNYDFFNTSPTDSQADLLITCTRNGGPANTPITVSIGPSTTSGSIASRQMVRAGGSERMSYNLYREASRASVWGQSVGVDTVSKTINVPNNSSSTIAFSIYGRIAAGQDMRVGSFADSLVLTVSY